MVFSAGTYLLLACSLMLNGWLLSSPSARANMIATWVHLIAKLFSRRFAFVLVICSFTFVGCDAPKRAVRLPAPAVEQPPCNLPVQLHKENWLGNLGQGSCVYASLTNHLRWLNRFEDGERIRSKYENGEYASRLMQRLDAEGLDYLWTDNADPRFLDYVSEMRTGCILWWKPSHCCTFQGWVRDANGSVFAAILDNNYPGKLEFTPREQFIRLWAGYGGFALAVDSPAATSIPYLSYKVE